MSNRFLKGGSKMKKVVIYVIIVVAVFLTIPIIRANRLAQQSYGYFRSVTVIVDAGHGGRDGGASSKSGVVERDLVFDITKMVEEHLRLNGFNVVLTRENECDLASEYAKNRKKEDLACRVRIFNETDSAIAVSIHANAIDNTRWSGAQVFYDAKSLENKELATHIMNAMRNNIDGLKRDQRPISNIYVLRHSRIPTALVEVGFLSNAAEAELLADVNYQKLLAYAIFEGILSFVETQHSTEVIEGE